MQKWLVWPVISTALMTLLGGCSPQKYSANYTNGLVYCSESDPISMNPQLDTSTTTADATAHQIYD